MWKKIIIIVALLAISAKAFQNLKANPIKTALCYGNIAKSGEKIARLNVQTLDEALAHKDDLLVIKQQLDDTIVSCRGVKINVKLIVPSAQESCSTELQALIDALQSADEAIVNQNLGNLFDNSFLFTTSIIKIKANCDVNDLVPNKDTISNQIPSAKPDSNRILRAERRNLQVDGYFPQDIQGCINLTQDLWSKVASLSGNVSQKKINNTFEGIEELISYLPELLESCEFNSAAQNVSETLPDLCISSIHQSYDIASDVSQNTDDTYYVLTKLPDLYLATQMASVNCPFINKN